MLYNTFNIVNISHKDQSFNELAEIFSLLGQPARLQIVLLIGKGEICVCHIEAVLGFRQAYISQQLMGLRQAGWVLTRREGRKIYYSLTDPLLPDVIIHAAEVFGIELRLPQIPEIDACSLSPQKN